MPVMSTEDRTKIVESIRTILFAVGEDPHREGLRETPQRVMRMYLDELLNGYNFDPDLLFTNFESNGYNQLVLVREIPFYSLCEHHMIPFLGRAHVGYIPKGKVVGLSKIGRLVEGFSRRLTIQERMTDEIARALDKGMTPNRGVMVVVEAEHLCMTMRGVSKPGTLTVTSSVRGDFLSDPAARAEYLSLLSRR